MSFIIRNNKISKILFIITISIILFSISLNVKAAENKIEIKDGNQIITDTTGTLKTPKVLNVNTNVEKKLTINYVGVDNNRLDYNLEEKEGNLDFDVNVLTGEIKLKVKSGTNFGAVFSLVDRQTKKVYPISLVIRAIDGKSKVSLLGSVKNMKFNTISGNMYLEGIADLKRVIEGGINPLNEKPTMYLKNLNTQRIVELSVEKVSTYEYRFRIKAEDMAEDDKYIIYAKIAKQNTYADNSSLERQLTIERAVPNTIENNRYKLTNSDDNISIKTKPVTYNLNANLVDMYGFHRGQNDYVIGTADIFLKDNDENRVKPREVKIYAEKNGNKTYFNVYNNRYDFELLLNNVEAGEYAIYAEAIGNNGKTYKEKLNISQGLRKNLTVSGMQTEARTGESKLVLTKKNKEKEPNYIIRTNTNSMYGFHRGDGNDYIIGTADIFLSDENGNRVKPREVKIYAEKDGKKTYFNVYNDRYDFELLLNNVEAGEYTIYAEATGNNGKTYKEKLWIGGHLRKNITVSGMQTETKVEEGKIIFKSLKPQVKPEPKEKLDKTNLNKKLKEVEDLVKGRELTENLKKDKTEESIRKYTEEYSKILSNLNSVKDNISRLGEDKTSENESKLNQYIRELDNIKNSLSVLNNILKVKVKEKPKPKLDKTILNNKLREVENLIKIKALTDGLKNNKTADSIKKYQDEYNKIMLRTNDIKSNISNLGEYKTQENENNLNQYINELDNIKKSLNSLNNILKIRLDKTNLNSKSKEVEELIKNKKLTEDKKKGKTEESINEYNTKLNEQISKFNNVNSEISKLGEEKTPQNESNLNNYISELNNIKTNLNNLDKILKDKLQPKPKLNKINLNNKLKEVEDLVKGRELTESLKKDKTEESIRKYTDEYSKIVLNLNSVKDNISKLGEDKTSENESKLNQYIRDLDNIKHSLGILNNILKVKEEKTEKKVEFNNISSIKLFQNSPYGEAWVTILENISTNISDYFIKIESNNHRPIILGVNKIEKVGNKYKIYGENIEYVLGENDLKSKDITKIKGYQNDKSNIYNNIIKLIPYYNLETVIEIGNKVNNSSVLNNKKINSIIPLNGKEVSSSEEVRNGLSNKVMIKFDDNTVEYYNLENLGKFKQFKEYNINLNGEKILYTPELGIENSKTKEVVNEIKQQFEKVNFLEDKKIFEILNPRIKALDKIKKRNEMKKQLGREVSDEELLKELQKITLEKMSYKNSFDNIQKNIDNILNTLLINNQNIITNNISLEKVKNKLVDNKEKVLLGLTYIDRLYNLKYSNINLKNLIIYYPEFFGKKVDIIDFLIMVGEMQYLEYKLDATPATFRKKFNYIFKEQTISEFLENMKNIFEPKLSINDWFKKASNAYIEEQKSEYNNNLEYQIFNKLKKDSEQKYLLPLLNVSENSIYAITTVTTTTFGIVDAYVDRDGTEVEREKQLKEFKEKLKETAKRQATFLDFWFRISNKDTHHNLISNRIVMDSLRIFNKNPYANARDTWSKEYGTQASKGVLEFVAPFDFYREFFVADGEANGLRSKYVPC